MRNRLTQLLADNRGLQGRRFEIVRPAAEAQDDAVEVFLYDAIFDSDLEAEWWGGVAPQSFVKALREITASTIHLRINSPGGSVFGARAIETALREHKAKVVVHIDGLAASAATFIAMAGDEVVMSPGAMFMIHNAWTYAWGNANDLTETAALLAKIDGTLVSTYAKRSGQEPEQIADWMAAETWFTAEEAKEAGLIDRIAEDTTEANAKAGVNWNLNAFLAKVSRPSAATAPQPDAQAQAAQEHRDRQQQRLRTLARTAIV
jgi:ATP-dependent Clp protease, protease subunit